MSANTEPAAWLSQAEALEHAGQAAQALQLYERVLAAAPAPAPLLAASRLHILSGNTALAVVLATRAQGMAPGDVRTTIGVGVALAADGQAARAVAMLQPVVDAEPRAFRARLFLGLAFAQLGEPAALLHCHRAVAEAQRLNHWRSDDSTPQWIREPVRRAIALIGESTRGRLHQDILALGADGTPQAVPRIHGFVDAHVAGQRSNPDDERQRPNQHFIPGLPASPWIATSLLPWAAELEANWAAIRDEFLAVQAQGQRLASFLEFSREEQVGKHLAGTRGAPSWDAFFFYRHGRRNEENCRLCPLTAALLDRLPLFELPEVAPEICYSVLSPGTHILPHRGDSNARIVIHLPLIVPDDCRLRVAGEARSWQEGQLLAFDDTYEHEAWNRSDAQRVVLILDAWNPDLNAAERQAFKAVVDGINRLARAWSVSS